MAQSTPKCFKPYAFAALALALTGCGPSDAEVGQAMQLWCFVLWPITIGFERVFVRVKYRMFDGPYPRLGTGIMLLLGVAPLLASIASVSITGWQGGGHFVAVGVVLCLGYLGYLAVAFVVAHFAPQPWSSYIATVAPFCLVLATATALSLLGSVNGEPETGIIVLALPLVYLGMYFVGLGLFVAAFIWAYFTPHRISSSLPIAKARFSSKR